MVSISINFKFSFKFSDTIINRLNIEINVLEYVIYGKNVRSDFSPRQIQIIQHVIYRIVTAPLQNAITMII